MTRRLRLWVSRAAHVAAAGASRIRKLVPRRLAAWRAVHDEQVLTTDVGPWKLRYHSSSVIGQTIAAGKGWEPNLAIALELLLPPGESLLIADVGSNFGASLAQMQSVHPRADFVCFEPSRRFRELLDQNIAANDWSNVRVEDLLVGASTGTAELYTNTSTASVAERDYGGHTFLGAEESRVVRLDDYFAEAPRLDLIKSDTDGFDTDVLLGAEAILGRLAPVVYFEFAPFLTRRVGRGAGDPLSYLGRLGYRTLLAFSQAGEPLALTDDPSEVIALAEIHKYVDVLTAVQPAQVAALAKVAEATAKSAPR